MQAQRSGRADTPLPVNVSAGWSGISSAQRGEARSSPDQDGGASIHEYIYKLFKPPLGIPLFYVHRADCVAFFLSSRGHISSSCAANETFHLFFSKT